MPARFGMSLTFTILLDGISLLELFDARLMIEPEFAAKTAERPLIKDLDEIRETLSAMLTNTVEADRPSINRYTLPANRLRQRMFEPIQELLTESMQVIAQLAQPRAGTWVLQAGLLGHTRAQARQARHKMIDHSNYGQAVVLGACLEAKLSRQADLNLNIRLKDVQ